MIHIRQSHERGAADHGWLKARHTFSFADYYDPAQSGYSDLLVINEDRILPSMGFGTHPHKNMEIFTYILDGALAHKDSMGRHTEAAIIRRGDVQMMSAGRGVLHSEFNPSNTASTHLLQIWIKPNQQQVEPRYYQINVPDSEKRGQLRCIIAPEGGNAQGHRPDIAPIYQDARVYVALLDGDEKIEWPLPQGRWTFLQVALGAMTMINSQGKAFALKAGDTARIEGEPSLIFTNGDNAEFLLFDLRPESHNPEN